MNKQKVELFRECNNRVIGFGEIITDFGTFFQFKDLTDPIRNIIVNFNLEGRILNVKLGENESGNEVIILERDFKGRFYLYYKNLRNLLPGHEGIYYYYDYYHENTENNLVIAKKLINQVVKLITKVCQPEYKHENSVDFINLKNNKQILFIPQVIMKVIKRIIKKYSWQGLLAEQNKITKIYPSKCILPPEVRPDQNTNYVILHITEGCWKKNKKSGLCEFCGTYNNIKYKEKGFKQLDQHLVSVKEFTGNDWRLVNKVFLLDADPLNTDINSAEYLKYIWKKNPNLKWFECFVSTKTILSKSINEWRELVNLGLKKVYWGVESADNDTLKIIGKNQNEKLLYKAANRLKELDFSLTVIVMSGIGGLNDRSEHKTVNNAHVEKTVKFITNIKCTAVYVSKFTLQKNTTLHNSVKLGELILLSDKEIEKQHREIIKKLNLNNQIEIKGGYGQQFV